MTNQVAIWAAVDAITKATTQRVWRDDGVDERSLIADYASRRVGLCDVASYRASVSGHGKIPSLWQQAEEALFKMTESTQGSNRSPLATRSVADVQLMETMLTMRELVARFFEEDDKAEVPTVAQFPGALRHMASEVLRRNVDMDLWTYRVEQLRRLLENHLQAIDRGPKPMRLRVRCPTCKTEHITIPDPDGNLDKHGKPQNIVVRPILAVYRDGMLRCFECQACTRTDFAGAGVHLLLADIQADEDSRKSAAESETMTA